MQQYYFNFKVAIITAFILITTTLVQKADCLLKTTTVRYGNTHAH